MFQIIFFAEILVIDYTVLPHGYILTSFSNDVTMSFSNF